MNRIQTLLKTPLVQVARFDHPAVGIHRDPAQETAAGYSISFVERGGFELQIGRQEWRLAPGMVFLTRPGLSYRCRHAEPIPADVCLSVSYAPAAAEELASVGGLDLRRRRARWVVPPTNRLAYLRLRLASWASESREPLAAEALAAELWSAAAEPGSGKLHRQSQLAWYGERIERTRAILETEYASPHTLAGLAREAGMSPYHFARVFRALMGVPPHRYLLRVRLARAAEQLRQGAGVTESCYACGFNNLSHFIRLFRRAFGVPPSRFAH